MTGPPQTVNIFKGTHILMAQQFLTVSNKKMFHTHLSWLLPKN